MHGDLPRRMFAAARGRRRLMLYLGLAIAAALVIFYAFSGSSQQDRRTARRGAGAEGPVPVLAVAAKRADVPIYLDAVGTIRALNTVTVRPQVDGKLINIAFNEGQDVNKGDILARIDPTTFKAQLDQATAKKAQDEAQLGNAKIDLERYERLAATASINRQQADTQRALVAQLEALVKSDQAAIDNAKAILDYTTIVAPLSGRTGIRQVDEGNVVRASDTSGIVVITQLKPISVLFNLPQQDLDRINKAFAKEPLRVEALRSDTDAVIDRGTLQVVDNQVDQSTGTVRLKAEFPNGELQLWPGQFVNVRLLIETLKDVVVVPTGAVQRGPNGTFVYVVRDDNTAAMRQVTVGQQDETQAVVTRGVEPAERVVTTGFARISDGSQVTVSTPGEPAGAAPRPARERGGNRERRQQQGGAGGGGGPPGAGGGGGGPPR
ncbi:MAG: efflux RND transporter periplasmic adaptor subunit [Pseudolabrys sp.]|nr:efflux RND transporter periplasmic adaptor subunit [Pseudolabrys sp.]